MTTTKRAAGESAVSNDTLEVLRYVTQDTRLNLLQDIIGHPQGSPSPKELDYTNPEVTQSTISEHLSGLTERGVIRRVEVPPDSPFRSRELPDVFYTLTEDGRELLDKYDILVDEEEEIKRDYANLEKPEDIIRAEEVPRPHRDPEAHEPTVDATAASR